MSPGSGVKSEYMKRYREPRWDEYAPCYRELLRYRLGRRLLEQAHAPWLWDSWGPDCSSDDSASSAASGSAPQCALAEAAEATETAEASAPEEPERPATEQGAEAGDEQDAAQTALPVKEVGEKPEQEPKAKETDKPPASVELRQQPSALFARGSRTAVRSPQRSSSKIRENRHPFALYGWGERQMDTGSQKTHNVCASAPEHEIHESALRAKNRRQVEKRRLAARRQRAHSVEVEVEKNRKVKAASAESPWVTEYMRCYSARA